jgi:hypothetical protein
MCGDLARSACETNRAVTIYRGQNLNVRRPQYASTLFAKVSAGRLFRSARVRVARDGSEFHRPKTYVALRRQTRKLPGESRMLSGGAGEIHQFYLRVNGRPPPERSVVALFWLGSKLDNVALWESGTGPFSRIAGLLLFPLRPSRGNCLSATTRFRFQWRRNRFACRNVLLWRFSGRPNRRSG